MWTHEHARGQKDRQTDRRTDERIQICALTNACIDERTHVRSNIWTHEHARGQTDRQTDGRTLTYGLTHVQMRTHER